MQHELSATSLNALPYCILHCKDSAVSASNGTVRNRPTSCFFDLQVGNNLEAFNNSCYQMAAAFWNGYILPVRRQ